MTKYALWQRPWPWARYGASKEDLSALTGISTLVMLGIPAALMAWVRRQDSWGWQVLPVCYAGACMLVFRQGVTAMLTAGFSIWLVLVALRSKQTRLVALALLYLSLSLALVAIGPEIQPWQSGAIHWSGWVARDSWLLRPFLMGLTGAPALAYWVLAGRALWRKRWALFGGLAGAALVITLVAAALLLGMDARDRLPEEIYSARGWHVIGFIGIYVTGLAVLIVLCGRAVITWIRRRYIPETARLHSSSS
jgi:hypothetical protein